MSHMFAPTFPWQIVSVNTGAAAVEPQIMAGWHSKGKPLAQVALGDSVRVSLAGEPPVEAVARRCCASLMARS